MIARCSRVVTWAVALALGAFQAFGQPYPSKPMRLITPHPPGSAPDTVTRAAAQELSPRLGQLVVVESRPGTHGLIAHGTCFKAAPDGHTLCLVTSDLSFAPHVVSKLPYDSDKDVRPVVRLFFLVQALMASAKLPADSLKDLEQLAEAFRVAQLWNGRSRL